MLTLLAQHPELQQKAREEIEALCGSCELSSQATGRACPQGAHTTAPSAAPPATQPRLPTFDELWSARSLPYCSLLVFEALRLSPGIEHMRLRTAADVTLATATRGTLLVPRGTTLIVSPSLLHRHPRFWPAPADQPRAVLFDGAMPTFESARLGVAADSKAGRGDGGGRADEDGGQGGGGHDGGSSFLPFSAGPKGCIASQFALYEMRMLLVLVLRRFELHVAPSGRQRVRLVDRTVPAPAAAESSHESESD